VSVCQAAAPERLPHLLPPRQAYLRGANLPHGFAADLDRAEAALAACDASVDAPVVVYISKMVAVPAMALPR
jgi:ribosome assembly protein 1